MSRQYLVYAEDCDFYYNDETKESVMTSCDGDVVFCIQGRKSKRDMFNILTIVNVSYDRGVTAGTYKQQIKIKDALGIDQPL